MQGVENILDDIIVHGTSHEEHDKRLNMILDRIREKGLTLKKNKCQLGLSEIHFMGHMVSDQGIGPTKERVLVHLNVTKPKTVSEVRRFLGLVNFSARYIPNLSTLCEPLSRLTKKGVKFEWRSEQDQCFSKLKECLAKSSTLGPFRLDAKKTLLVTDASNVGLGSVLIQQDDKGNVKIICYANRSLTDVEKRYSTFEKEVIAVVWGCENFRLYL